MKIRKSALIAATSLLMCMSCGQPPVDVTVAQGSERGFALSFFKNVIKTTSRSENVSVSPYSAGVALSMLAEGADGSTLEELDKALAGCRLKAEDLSGADSIVLKSANALWTNANYPVRKSYAQKLSDEYEAVARALDFVSDDAAGIINEWARANTAGRIDNVVERLSPDMVAILSNALYFKAPWQNPFDAYKTADGVFHGISSDSPVRFMNETGGYEYAEYDGNQVVRIPYLGGRFAMTVVLPSAKVGVEGLEAYLNEFGLDELENILEYKRIKLSLPKFRVEAKLSLIPALRSMGVEAAFSQGAVLSGIAEGPLVVSEVNQKTFVDVNEYGSEAAAVTTIGVKLTSIRDDRDIPAMKVDRPFYYMISDLESGRIYFIGRIVNI
ncbi:MAG: serpin family protein [Candidatus Cryptobacteroides sp.]